MGVVCKAHQTMDTVALILILWSAFLGSSMVLGELPTTLNTSHHKQPSTSKTTYNYDVTKFGAVGNGKTYDTRAFQSAWKAACSKETDKVKIIVPEGKTFLVYSVKFEGPCKSSSITFEILGNIVAPPRSAWRKKGADEWLYFHRINGLILEGNRQGLINGLGDTWWNHTKHGSRPTAMRFSHCTKLKLRGLKHINSQQNHISINACNEVTISHLEMRAPQKSPNTDGIDISASTNLHIHDCIMATGDDCIAINGGTSNVNISNVACGPGHGISIGSLGKKGRHDEVEGISVTNCTFNGTQNGVRIKTWQGGSGFARNITFSNINFIAANNPVIIDQYYCPHKKCSNKTSAVEVSDVRYYGLHGTSICKNATINLSCSKAVPCNNIILDDVDIESANPNNSITANCINAHGQAHTLNPIVNCLCNNDWAH